MSESKGRVARRAGKVIAWAIAVAAVFAIVAALTFFATLKLEMRATEVEVPDVSGRTVEEGSRVLEPLGLPIEVVEQRHDDRVSSGKILEQQPVAGSSVRRGRKVRGAVSLGTAVLKIPDLVGQADRTSRIAIEREGLGAGDEARVPSREAPAGTVIAQVPPAGSPAVAGMRVHLLVSSGPETPRWVMPDLSGLTLARAEGWIENSGFRKGSVRRLDATGKPAGTVVGQLPAAGYPARARDVVELTVAR